MAFTPAPQQWGDIPGEQNTPTPWGFLPKSHSQGRVGAGVHSTRICLCAWGCMCVHVCFCNPQVYFALQFRHAVLPETVGKKIRAFLLYDSAQNTTCRLRAFSSQMSLSPQWRAWRVDAQPSDVPSLGSRGTPQPAVQSPEGCQAWLCSSNPFPLLLREQVYSLGPSSTLSPQTQPPRNCWAPSKHVLVSETFLFYGTLTYSCHIDLLLHES